MSRQDSQNFLKMSNKEELSKLDILNSQLRVVNAKRRVAGLSEEEREVLELSAVALRDAQRVEIAAIRGEIIEELNESSAKIKGFAKEIRERVAKMNQFAKDVDSVEMVARAVVKVLTAVGKW